MINRRLVLPLALVLLGMVALAAPLRLLAQTAEPTPTLAATPDPAAPTATADPNAPFIPRVHTVQDGENLTMIATQYDVAVEDILAINNLANGDLLQVGQELIIPGGTGEAVATFHVVGVGDTLAGVAAAFNTTLDDVIATNKLITTDPPLLIGQTVPLISRTGSGAARPVNGRPYLATAGDTLLLVAARFGLTPQALAEANGLSDGAIVVPGLRLRIPDETAVYRSLPEGWLDVRLNPTTVAQGQTVSIYVENLLPGKPAGRFGDQPLNFAPHEDGYAALVGIDAFTEPGIYDLEISGGDERGLWEPLRARVPLVETDYGTQNIEVGEELNALLDPQVRATEDAFLREIFAQFSEEPRWDGVFQTPVTTTIVSAGYGGSRSYNGGPVEIYHTGVDYAVPEGTDVLAPAPGVVVFSDTLELRGNVIIIDHGMGVMTGYYHLVELIAMPGDEVAVGDVIGRVGSTGLSSGAHLHWDLRIMNVTVDPTQWTLQAFP